MKTVAVEFDFQSWWQAGTGRGQDETLDTVVARDADGLPILPGRTVKGLLRDGYRFACAVGALPNDASVEWFGSSVADQEGAEDGERALEEGRFRTRAGKLAFGSATLPGAWTQWVRSGATDAGASTPHVVDALYRRVSSTAIDESGVARDQTLRVFEVVAPMKLTAIVDGPGDGAWVEELRTAASFVRSCGSRRNRGYGRVRVTVKEVG